jgi:hypothetical protein
VRKILFVLAVLMLFNLVQADMPAPPPSIFHITFNGSNVTGVFYATALRCYGNESLADVKDRTAVKHPNLLVEEYDASRNCTWYPSTEEWEEECSDSLCHFAIYSFDSIRLVVYIPSANRTFVSSPVPLTSISSEFSVSISPTGEVAIEKIRDIPIPNYNHYTPIITDYLTLLVYALVVSLVVELAASFVYTHIRRLDKRILWSVALANIISVPVFWLVLQSVETNILLFWFCLFFGEIAVFVFEAVVIYLLNRKRIGILDSFAISFINNLLSFLVGAALILFFSIV